MFMACRHRTSTHHDEHCSVLLQVSAETSALTSAGLSVITSCLLSLPIFCIAGDQFGLHSFVAQVLVRGPGVGGPGYCFPGCLHHPDDCGANQQDQPRHQKGRALRPLAAELDPLRSCNYVLFALMYTYSACTSHTYMCCTPVPMPLTVQHRH